MVYPFLFSPLRLGPLQLRNRITALPVHTGFARPNGFVSSWMNDFYAGLADSGAAMVVVANAAVAEDGRVSKFNLRADRDAFIPGLTDLATAIKDRGALACLQLNHAGRFARTRRPLLPAPITRSHLAFNIESLRAFMGFFPFEKRFSLTRYFLNQIRTWRTAMTDTDQNRVMADFAEAASRAYKAGFDLVELHGANGYLLCQYLSRFTNTSESNEDNDLSRRAAFPLAVIDAVKKRLPPDFPLGFRLIVNEWVPDGIDPDQAIEFSHLLEKAGIAYLSISTGTFNSLFSPMVMEKTSREAYLRDEGARLRKTVDIPIIISGRITTPFSADRLIREGAADLIGLGRALRTDPGWIQKAGKPNKKIIACINCNFCLKNVILEQGFICRRWPRIRQERTELAHKMLTRYYNTLWVIAGPKDIEAFKTRLELLIQGKITFAFPGILFVQGHDPDDLPLSVRDHFLQWVIQKFNRLGMVGHPLKAATQTFTPDWENELTTQINQGCYGRIFTGPYRGLGLQDHILYRERGKVMAFLGTGRRQNQILVLLDLSDTSLLVMGFLEKTLMKDSRLAFTFMHLLTPGSEPVDRRWKKIKRITRVSPQTPLKIIPSTTDVITPLVAAIQTGKYGTVIMGKRGLSGIKRWLLGSVSSGVLKHLTDQTLFLID
jgi:2,4-dienoyl-CoA reductase (NADPH2)